MSINIVKKNSIKVILILIALIIVLMITGIVTLSLYRADKRKLTEYQRQSTPAIVCIGDSLTAGAGGDGVNYPDVLNKNLQDNGYKLIVQNLGIGGESTSTIAGRMGAIPFVVDEFEIPADVAEVPISFIDVPGEEVHPARGEGNGLNPCSIQNVIGKISYLEENDQYYFTRTEPGESVQVPSGTMVTTDASVNYTDGIFIIFMGENHGWNDDPSELIRQQKAIIDKQKAHDGRYIIVGLSTGTESERAVLDDILSNEYGEKFVNVRKLLSEQGMQRAGLEPTEQDKKDIENGRVPESLRADEIHYNHYGYEVLGDYMYEKIKDLGYLDDIDVSTNEFMKKWGTVYKFEMCR